MGKLRWRNGETASGNGSAVFVLLTSRGRLMSGPGRGCQAGCWGAGSGL